MGNVSVAYDRFDNDDFWRAKFAEARANGGSVEVDLADIPPVPGIVFCLPSGDLCDEFGGKLHIEGAGPPVVIKDIRPDWVDDFPEHPAMATGRLRLSVPQG